MADEIVPVVPSVPATADVPVTGECVTRNGISKISRMVAVEEGGGKASLRFVSVKLRRALHAGAEVEVEDLDKFCLAWLHSRGHALKGADVGRRVLHEFAVAADAVHRAMDILTRRNS